MTSSTNMLKKTLRTREKGPKSGLDHFKKSCKWTAMAESMRMRPKKGSSLSRVAPRTAMVRN